MKAFKNLNYIKIAFSSSRILTGSMVLIYICKAVMPVLQTLAIARLLDSLSDVFSSAKITAALIPLAILFLVLLANYAIRALGEVTVLKLKLCLENRLKPALVTKINRLAYEHIENDEDYDLLERVGEDLPSAVQDGFVNVLDLAEIMISIGGLIGIIVGSSIPVALVCILLIIPVVMIAQKSGNEAYVANAQIAPHARRTRYLRSILSSREAASERKLFGFSEQINQYWNKEMDRRVELDYQADRKIFTRSKCISVLFALLLVAMALLMLWPVKQKSMSVGVYISLVISLSTLIHTMSWQLSEMLKEYTSKRLYLEDLERLEKLTEIPGSDSEPETHVLTVPFENLAFDHVSFTYPQSTKEVLHEVSLKLHPGKQYALVGKNGCGKSTVIKLLAGLYANYTGRIVLNNQDINSFTAAERKAYFSIAYQDYAKYQVTLREQITLGNPNLTSEEMDALFSRMDLGQKIKSFPKGLDTLLGKLSPESADLSEGQWQRVNLARSFSHAAKVFVFDEPAAALDALAENKLYETIKAFSSKQQMTVLYVTHRLAAARLADEIIVMDEGRIIEQGTHAALIAHQGHYAKMFESQAKWYRPKKVDPL